MDSPTPRQTSASNDAVADAPLVPAGPVYSLMQITGYALQLGTTGFGGPVALVGYMHRDLVERRGWISESDYKEGLALAQLAPGPLAAQLMIYLGYVHYGVLGATLAGLAFIIPSFIMVVALGYLYVLYGGLSWMQAIFYGVGACVIGIIANSAYKLTRKSIGKDWLLWFVYAISAGVTIITETEIAWLFLASGVLVWAARTWPKRPPGAVNLAILPLAALPAMPVATQKTLWQLFWFFTEAGAFVFGSGLAIVPFLYGGVVTEHQWLTERQFVDAVAVAMITPGPVVITVGFIGFLIGGFPGACIAAIAVFLPCYLLTILPAPYFKKYGKRPGIIAFVDGVTAAAIGAITGAVYVLGKRSVFDLSTVIIAATTLILLWRFKKLPEPILILAAALIGLILYPLINQ